MKYSRRIALQLALALWAKAEQAAHEHPAPPPQTGETKEPKFLTRAEVTTIQRFAVVMMPATEHSRGAARAGVEGYIDHVLSLAAPSLQRAWRTGLAAWGKSKNVEATLDAAVVNEFAPKSKEDQFFILFKSALTAAFYTSEEGIMKELGYQGMGFLREFPGYQGEAFTAPADYKPLLRSRG